MRPFFAIVRITIMENIRSKIMPVLLVVGVGFTLTFACCGLGSDQMVVNGQQLAVQSQVEMFFSAGFWILTIFGGLGSIFLGMNVLSADINSHHIMLIFTRPIYRVIWLLGKITGTWLTVVIDTLVLFVVVYGLALIKTKSLILGPFPGMLVLVFLFLALTTLVIVLSLFLANVGAGFVSFLAYLTSWVLSFDVLQAYFFQIENYFQSNTTGSFFAQFITEPPSVAMQAIYSAMYWVVPQFGNVQGLARKIAANSSIDLALDWWSLLFLLIYGGLLLALGQWQLQRRSL